MPRTICLYESNLRHSNVDLFDDNGFQSDGNALLPREPLEDNEAVWLVGQGKGEFVNAVWLSDAEVSDLLDIRDVLGLAEETDDWDALKNAVRDHDRVRLWAHYGAYGASDSLWVIVLKTGERTLTAKECADNAAQFRAQAETARRHGLFSRAAILESYARGYERGDVVVVIEQRA